MPANADPDAVRSYYELVDNESYGDLFALFAEDVTYHRPGQRPIEGKAEFREFYHEGRPLSDGDHTVHAVVAEDDTVAVRGEFAGRQAGDRVAFGFADVHRFDADGLVEARWTYTDRDAV
jgi:hypothetical protein